MFDEGYGVAVPLLRTLNLAGRLFVAEVPVTRTGRSDVILFTARPLTTDRRHVIMS